MGSELSRRGFIGLLPAGAGVLTSTRPDVICREFPLVESTKVYTRVQNLIRQVCVGNHDCWPFDSVLLIDWVSFDALISYHIAERKFYNNVRMPTRYGVRHGIEINGVPLYPSASVRDKYWVVESDQLT